MAGESEGTLQIVSGEEERKMVCKIAEREREKMRLELKVASKINLKVKVYGSVLGKGMLDNDTYNLMEQLEIENKSLWRIKNNYKNDASTDNQSRQLWSLIEKEKEEVVRLLTEKVRERL